MYINITVIMCILKIIESNLCKTVNITVGNTVSNTVGNTVSITLRKNVDKPWAKWAIWCYRPWIIYIQGFRKSEWIYLANSKSGVREISKAEPIKRCLTQIFYTVYIYLSFISNLDFHVRVWLHKIWIDFYELSTLKKEHLR